MCWETSRIYTAVTSSENTKLNYMENLEIVIVYNFPSKHIPAGGGAGLYISESSKIHFTNSNF